MRVLLVTGASAEERLAQPILGLPLGLRAILLAQDAGAESVEVSGPSAEALLLHRHDVRVTIPVVPYAAARDERIVMQADTLVSPALLRKMTSGQGVLSHRNLLAAARKAFAPGDKPATPISGLPLAEYEWSPEFWAVHVQDAADAKLAARMLLERARGPRDSAVATLLLRRVSRPISGWVAARGWSRMVVTGAALLVAVVAAVLISLPYYGTRVMGALLYLLHAVLACADGEVARVQRRATPNGAIANRLVNDLADIIVWLGLALGVARDTGMTWPYTAGILSLLLWTVAIATRYAAAYRRRVRELPADRAEGTLGRWLRRDTIAIALVPAALLGLGGVVVAALPFIAVGAGIRSFAALRRTLGSD